MDDAPTPPEDFDAAFEAAAARLRAAVAEACARPGPWPGRVGATIEAALAFAAEDPAAARLLLVEPWRRGGGALPAHERLLDHFADLLAAGRTEAPGGEELPAISERFLVADLAPYLGHPHDRFQRACRPTGEECFVYTTSHVAIRPQRTGGSLSTSSRLGGGGAWAAARSGGTPHRAR